MHKNVGFDYRRKKSTSQQKVETLQVDKHIWYRKELDPTGHCPLNDWPLPTGSQKPHSGLALSWDLDEVSAGICDHEGSLCPMITMLSRV